MDVAPTPYDALAYPTFVHPQLHPDRIATVAWLVGLDVAPAGVCRYLELGCGDAGTLIGLAYALPGSTFVGIDLAPTAVARAREVITDLGLTNIDVRVGDVAELPDGLGTFDQIVCHGVYSWVGEAAREAILETFSTHLADDGVAFVSYNANPAGLLREMSRQMLRFHLRRSQADPEAAFEEARNLLGFVSGTRPSGDPWRLLLESELDHLRNRPASSFVHDELAEVNTPFWLHEVLDAAAAHGLQMLGEAEDVGTLDVVLPQPAQALLANLEDEPEVREQYLDFFLARRFRQTLLCRADRALVRPVDPRRMFDVLVASPARPAAEPVGLADDEAVEFLAQRSRVAVVTSPAVKAALCLLGPRWPVPATFPSLVEGVRRLVPGADDVALAAALLQLVPSGHVRLSKHEPTWPTLVADLAERPVASALARRQVAHEARTVASLRAEPVSLDRVSRALLTACDGTRDERALVAALAPVVEPGLDPVDAVTIGLRRLGAAALLER